LFLPRPLRCCGSLRPAPVKPDERLPHSPRPTELGAATYRANNHRSHSTGDGDGNQPWGLPMTCPSAPEPGLLATWLVPYLSAPPELPSQPSSRSLDRKSPPTPEGPVQLVINTFGASLRKQGEQFVVKAGDKKFAVSAHKVQCILLTTAVRLTTDAIELATA